MGCIEGVGGGRKQARKEGRKGDDGRAGHLMHFAFCFFMVSEKKHDGTFVWSDREIGQEIVAMTPRPSSLCRQRKGG